MLFKFKKKKIVVDCFTADPLTFEQTPIAPATQYLPQWWKSLPAYASDGGNHYNNDTESNTRNMKGCVGFTQYFKQSLAIPLWGGIRIDLTDNIEKKYRWLTAYNTSDLGMAEKADLIAWHGSQQFHGFLDDTYQHLKISAPWRLKCKYDIPFAFTDPVWCRNDITSYTTLPGILNFKYQHAVNVNIFVQYRAQPRTIVLQLGQPLAFLTPLTEDEVIFKPQLVSSKELRRHCPINRFIFDPDSPSTPYNQSKKFINQKEDRESTNKGCPFGFGKK